MPKTNKRPESGSISYDACGGAAKVMHSPVAAVDCVGRHAFAGSFWNAWDVGYVGYVGYVGFVGFVGFTVFTGLAEFDGVPGRRLVDGW